jgi:hypothetical protein
VARHDRHPPILIATSFQALNRALSGRQDTRLCDCAIVILFAGLWLEANLNYLIQHLGKAKEMRAFLGERPGLGDKLAWYYNAYAARTKAASKKEFKRLRVHQKVRARFHGFAKLHRFRNDLSHGVINASAESIPETQQLRTQAKGIVNALFAMAARNGHDISQPTDYYKAIGVTLATAPPNKRLQPAAHGGTLVAPQLKPGR